MTGLTCVVCGSTELNADYTEPAYQGIRAEMVDGAVQFDYDGYYGTFDGSGEDESYRCGECHAQARSVEALVGEDPDGAHERLALVRMIQGKLSEAAALAEELARTPIGEPPLRPESEMGPSCRKCGTQLTADGRCADETCPYSNRAQGEPYTAG